MRSSNPFLSSFLVVSALFFSLPGAIVARSLRQHVEPRAFLDVCATIDEYALASLNLALPRTALKSCLDICLCISALPTAIQANAELRLLAKTHGEALIKSDLALLINSARNRENCYYPDNSHPACTPYDPCAFDCESPFVPRGHKCICPHPYKLCNGVCGMFTHGCGSAVSHPYKRGLSSDLKARSHGIFTHEDALSTCAHGEKVCGVYMGSAAFECLNTDVALESCGGCMSPNPFLFMSEQGPEGVDCTGISHVQDVRCSRGHCVVERCEDGFLPSSDRSACIFENVFAQQGQPKIQAPAAHW